ncbi:hypothetical protein [Streptomyces acidicola]|uniref:hypothetical protein n=1 Tax=Streptomyces acidicola TaxID=2596892 RepID=UPI00381EC789
MAAVTTVPALTPAGCGGGEGAGGDGSSGGDSGSRQITVAALPLADVVAGVNVRDRARSAWACVTMPVPPPA